MRKFRDTTTNNNRILWIDGAKTLGILLVVLGHMSVAESIVTSIFSFHMALFFFISGYLEKHNQIRDSFKNAIRGLIIPYVFFYILSFFWWFQVSLIRHPEIYGKISFESAFMKPMLGMLFGVGYCTDYSTMVNVPLWFLIGLFVVKLLHSLIILVCRGNIKKYMLINIPLIVMVLVIKKMGYNMLFSIDSALLAFPFFSIGYLVQQAKFDLLNNYFGRYLENIILKSIFIVLTFVTLLTLSNFNGRVDINEYIYGNNIVLFYLNGLLGIVLIISIASFYNKQNEIITSISNGTIIIVAFHIYLSEILCKAIGMKGEGIVVNPFIALLIGMITIVLMVIPIRIIEKHFPILMGKKARKS